MLYVFHYFLVTFYLNCYFTQVRNYWLKATSYFLQMMSLLLTVTDYGTYEPKSIIQVNSKLYKPIWNILFSLVYLAEKKFKIKISHDYGNGLTHFMVLSLFLYPLKQFFGVFSRYRKRPEMGNKWVKNMLQNFTFSLFKYSFLPVFSIITAKHTKK